MISVLLTSALHHILAIEELVFPSVLENQLAVRVLAQRLRATYGRSPVHIHHDIANFDVQHLYLRFTLSKDYF